MTENKTPKTMKELLKWIERNVKYNYYDDNKYRDCFKILKEKEQYKKLNCSDRVNGDME